MASGSDDKSVRMWERDAAGGAWRSTATVEGVHKRAVYSVDWSRIGAEELATAGGDNHVRVLAGSAPFQVLADSGSLASDVNCVRWNPKEAGLLASCGDDRVVRIWRRV